MNGFKIIAHLFLFICLSGNGYYSPLYAQDKLPFNVTTKSNAEFFEITVGGCPGFEVPNEQNYNKIYSQRFLNRNLWLTDKGNILLYAVYGNEAAADFCLVHFKNFEQNFNKVIPVQNLQFKWLGFKNKLHIKLTAGNSNKKSVFNTSVLDNALLKANNILSFDEGNFTIIDTFSTSALGFKGSYNLFESLITFPVTKFTLINGEEKAALFFKWDL